jgi:hypothetical protein
MIEKNIDNGIDGQTADMFLLVLGVLVNRMGGTVHVTLDEIEKVDGGLTTIMSPDGIILSTVDEIPMTDPVRVQ